MITKYVLEDKETGEFLDYAYDPEVAEMLSEWITKKEGIQVVIKERNEELEGLDL